MQNSLIRYRYVCLAIASIVLFGSTNGCQSKSTVASAPGGIGTAPIAEVQVATAYTRHIVEQRQFTGRTTPVNSVDIRARVSGYLLETPRLKAAIASPTSDIKTFQSSQLDQSNQGDQQPSSESKSD